jgi:hypothetical protein
LTEIRYRTYVVALLQQIMSQSGLDDIAKIDKRRTAEQIGVSHQTFYDWWDADPTGWDNNGTEGYLSGYTSRIELKFRQFFAEKLGLDPKDVTVVEDVEVDPEYRESTMLVAAAA